MTNTDKIIQRLKNYGADIDGSMDRMLNDKDFYLECIGIFLKDENFEKLNKGLTHNDLCSAFEAAHALKGVSANLGLTPIYNEVCNIVEPLRQRKNMDYIELYERLILSKNKLDLLLNN